VVILALVRVEGPLVTEDDQTVARDLNEKLLAQQVRR
jgi:hypothetical protein